LRGGYRTEKAGARKPSPIHSSVQIVALASSADGPPLLQELQVGLPAGFLVPILAVQHLAKRHAANLAGALAPNCRMRVKLAEASRAAGFRYDYIAPRTAVFGSGHLAASW
jgi:chemotaxis response regulator CheB